MKRSRSLFLFLCFLFVIKQMASAGVVRIDSLQRLCPILSDTSQVTLLEEVVVTGTRTRCPMKNLPIPIHVVPSKEIEAVQARSVEDLLQMVVPGIQTSTHGVQRRMKIAGLSADYFLFLVDGERLTNEGAGAIDLERIDPNSIERVEVLQGSSSALYGSNAIGGVVNIITKRSAKRLSVGLNAHYDSQTIQRYSGRVGVKYKGLHSTTTGNFNLQRAYELPSVSEFSRRIMPGFMSYSIGEKIGYRTPDGDFSIKASGYYNQRMQDYDDKIKYRYISPTASLQSLYRLAEGHDLEASYHFDMYDRDTYYYTAQEDPFEPLFSYHTHTGRLQYNYENVEDCYKPTFNVGLEVLREGLKSDRLAQQTRRYGATTGTLYGQMLWRMTRHFSSTVGIRTDVHSAYGAHLTPRLSLMWRDGAWAVRASYSEGFRSPSLKELYMDWEHMGMFRIKGNEKLKPETSRLVMITPEYSNQFISISLTGSMNQINQRIFIRLEEDGTVQRYINGEKPSLIWNATALLRLTPIRGLNINLNYAFIVDEDRVTGADGQKAVIRNSRPHSVNGMIQYGHAWGKYHLSGQFLGRYLSGVTSAIYNSETKNYDISSFPGYALFRASITQEWARFVSLTIGCDNLFNYMTPVVEQGASLSPGRSFFVSLSLNH